MAKKENELDFYLVDKKYIRDLSNYDNHVLSVSPQVGKDTRPFLGIIIIMDKKEYCIPLTSPKEKFNIKTKEDFIKIPDPKLKNENGAPITIGILNINNMIPISQAFATKINLYKTTEFSQPNRSLMIKQLDWCRQNKSVIQNKANKVYKTVTQTPEKNCRLTARCLDFIKLEKVLEKALEKRLSKQDNLSDIDKLNWYKNVLNKAEIILSQNPELNKMYQETKQEFFKNHSDQKPAKPINKNASISEQIKAAKALKDEYSMIIVSNPKLKAEYLKAKEHFEYLQKQVAQKHTSAEVKNIKTNKTSQKKHKPKK